MLPRSLGEDCEVQIDRNHVYICVYMYCLQWHAALLVALEPLNSRYPAKAPTPTASMIQPLYVMNKSLPLVSFYNVCTIPSVLT